MPWTKSFFCLLSLFSICLADGNIKTSANSYPVIKAKSGLIAGAVIKVNDENASVFLGIPYAKPPMGDQRFKKPVPTDEWKGILDATMKPPPCMQYTTRNFSWYATSQPSEDCLYLNIWTPGVCGEERKKLPVMVWIYGGGFTAGSTDMDVYDGATLASYGNVIVVSINYRVGIFGFLGTGTEDAPGNMGLHDQNLALKWVNENIECFGGDPNDITLFGESAGSVSVGLHIISPLSKGLFQRAIMESGSPYHPSSTDPLPVAQFKSNIVAQILNCTDEKQTIFTDPKNIVSCLRDKDALQLSIVENEFTKKIPYFFLPMYGEEFIPKSPMASMDAGEFTTVDVLTGNNNDEGTIFLNYLLPEIFSMEMAPPLRVEDAKKIIYGMFQNLTSPKPEDVVKYYLQNATDTDPTKIVQAIADSYGDYIFVCPTMFFAEKMKNAYYYWFNYRSPSATTGEWMGVTHFAEIPFVFGKPLVDSHTFTPHENSFSSDVIKKWVTFVRQGKPVDTESTVQWPNFTKDHPQAQELKPDSTAVYTIPRLDACNFWRPYFNH